VQDAWLFSPPAKQLVRAEIHLRRGLAVVWAANLLHGGSPIHDPTRTRGSQVTHYYSRLRLHLPGQG
jgi:hypothetical protein